MRIACLNGSPEDPNEQEDLNERSPWGSMGCSHVQYENDHQENMFSMMDGSDADDTSLSRTK